MISEEISIFVKQSMSLKIFNTILLLATASISLFAQGQADDEYVLTADSIKDKDKLHYNFEVGVGVGNSNAYGSFFNTYYKPSISYDVNERLRINTGILYMNSQINNFSERGTGYVPFSGSISDYYAYVSGEYLLTENLIVGGSLFYDFRNYSYQPDGSQSQLNRGNGQMGYSAYFKYKAAKNMIIQGEIRVGGRSPFNQYSNSFFNSSFGHEFSTPFRR